MNAAGEKCQCVRRTVTRSEQSTPGLRQFACQSLRTATRRSARLPPRATNATHGAGLQPRGRTMISEPIAAGSQCPGSAAAPSWRPTAPAAPVIAARASTPSAPTSAPATPEPRGRNPATTRARAGHAAHPAGSGRAHPRSSRRFRGGPAPDSIVHLDAHQPGAGRPGDGDLRRPGPRLPGVRQVLVTANGVELWRQDNRSQQPAMAVNLR